MVAALFGHNFDIHPCQKVTPPVFMYTPRSQLLTPDHCHKLLIQVEVWSDFWQLPRPKVTPILQNQSHAFTLKYLTCCSDLSVGMPNLLGTWPAKPKPTWMPQTSPNSKNARMPGDKTARRLLASNFESDLRRVTCMSRFWLRKHDRLSARGNETAPYSSFTEPWYSGGLANYGAFDRAANVQVRCTKYEIVSVVARVKSAGWE